MMDLHADGPLLRADARANRVRLIEAAREVFRERGLEAEMREVAERAGLGIATLYRNFATREELVEAMTGELLQEMWSALDALLSRGDPGEALRRFLHDGFSMLEEYGDLMSIVHESRGRGHDDLHQRFGEVLERISDFLRRGMQMGAFRADLDVELAATHILSSFQPWCYKQFRRSRSLEQMVDIHVRLLLEGIQSRAPNPSELEGSSPY